MKIGSRKIRILYQVLPDLWGGTESHLFATISGLNRERFEPIVYSYSNGIVLNRLKKLEIPIHIIDSYQFDNLDNLAGFLKRQRIDIAQTNHLFPMLAAASQIAGVPHIWYVGGHFNYTAVSSEDRRIMLNFVTTLSKRVICKSNFLKEQFAPSEHKKISVIYSGIDLNRVKKIKNTRKILNRFGCGPGDFIVGMIANLYPQKRHIDFIRAAVIISKRAANVKFIISGSEFPGAEGSKYVSYLRETIKSLKIEKNIIFTGFITDILESMSAMDLIVLPTIKEGFGNVVMEAMALGKPVIGSDSGGLPELIEDGVTGLLVPVKDHKRLAEAILEIMSDPALAANMGRAAKDACKNMFDLKRSVKKYEALYEQIYASS